MTTVSAIVPTRNRAHTLERALRSVLAQTRPPDEIIVVDDGSTDGTAALLERFGDIRVLRWPDNRGAAAARNEGLRHARGDYVAFLDSDDCWAPRKLETQLAAIASRPGTGLLCTGIEVHFRDGRTCTYLEKAPAGDRWTMSDFLDYPFSPSTWLMRADALRAAGGFDETLANCEDLDLLARIGPGGGISVLPEVLTVKYNQADSLDADPGRRAASLAVLVSRHRDLWPRPVAAVTWQKLALLQFQAGNAAAGRKALVEAIRQQPWRPWPWGLLVLSLCGSGAYMRVRAAFGRRPN